MIAKLTIALAASLLIAGSAHANGHITGTVFSKNTSEPLDYATVVLIDPETGSPLQIGATTDETGLFTIHNVPESKHLLHINICLIQ